MSMSDENKTAEELARLEAERNKVVFSQQQQDKVNELIHNAMGRAGADARAETQRLATEAATLKQQLADANDKLAKAKDRSLKPDEAAQREIEEVKNASLATTQELARVKDQLKLKDAETAQAREEAVNIRKTGAIQSAAARTNFINTEIVAKLTADNIKWDATKGKFTVVADNGTPRLNASFEDMSLDEFYADYAAKNPYLVRGDVRPGVGSSENGRFDISNNGKYEVKQIFGKGSSAVAAQKLMNENPAEYRRLRKIAVESGLLAA
jgi:hypothetical protein